MMDFKLVCVSSSFNVGHMEVDNLVLVQHVADACIGQVPCNQLLLTVLS